jgi:tetratricopeptide (TPR) repeat protein
MPASTLAQWKMIKGSLQNEVKVLEETSTRLVLYREDSTATLVLTITRRLDADIYGALEARRGGNAYRVWVTTESFWAKPYLAEDGGKKFFRETFLKTLRQDESVQNLPPAAPAEKEKTFTEKDSPSIPTLAEQIETKAQTIENTKVQSPTTDSLLEVGQKENLPPSSIEQTQPQAPAKIITTIHKPEKAASPIRKKESVSPQPPSPSAEPATASFAFLDSLYQVALQEIKKENWSQAVAVLERIQSSQPAYRDVADRLVQARVLLNLTKKFEVKLKPRGTGEPALFIGGALAAMGAFTALVLLPLIGVILFSPTFRAHYHLWRNDHNAAAQIYERALERHPSRVKYYPPLANIYLRQGRKDEKAIKVYRMILQLNLVVRNREEIDSIVTQNYLAAGKAQTDVIEVLESALKAEQRRTQN